MEEPVHAIYRKGLDKFQWHSTGWTGWFKLNNENLKRKFSTLEPNFYKRIFEKDIEGQDIEKYKPL